MSDKDKDKDKDRYTDGVIKHPDVIKKKWN
jgi:hypothetical protein